MKKRSVNIFHMVALNVVGYGIVFADPRITTGVVGYMLSHYSRAFVVFWAIWAFFAVLLLLWYKPAPVWLGVACLPILAYAVMGVWYMVSVENTPISAFIFPSLSMANMSFLISLRIRGIARGLDDDTLLPPLSTD